MNAHLNRLVVGFEFAFGGVFGYEVAITIWAKWIHALVGYP